MGLFTFKYLNQDQLRRLDKYKYAAVDDSPLSNYIMHPFWDLVVKLVPMSVAPNVLTIAGLSCSLINVFILTYYDYNFKASSDNFRSTTDPVPPIVWLICAINLFLAYTLDGIDGKQARRTKATSPVGELLDHGIDSLSASFIPTYIYSFFGCSDHGFGPHRMFYVFWAVFFSFSIAHLEKYATGVLYLPWTLDLSFLFIMGCAVLTYTQSYTFWKTPPSLIGWDYSRIFELILHLSILSTLLRPSCNVYGLFKEKKTKYSTFADLIRPFFSIFFLFVVSAVWAEYSPTDVISQDPRVYYTAIGITFSNIVCRIIVCQMTSTRVELLNGLTIIFSLVASLFLTFPFLAVYELLAMRLLTLALVLAHVHYAVCVVRQLCDHYKICCFSLKKR